MSLSKPKKLLGLLLLGGLVACRKENAPAPIKTEQIPNSIDAAFDKAKPDVQKAASEVKAALQRQEIWKAFLELRQLAERSDLTPAQREVTTSAMVNTAEQLRIAASRGDKNAAKILKAIAASK